MQKVCPENEAIKRRYVFFLEAAEGLQGTTVDSTLRAIERFELSTRRKPFSKFHIEQARAFRASLIGATGADGKPLSAATVTATLKRLRHFFGWLSTEPGYRSKLRRSDAAYFTPTEQDRRVAGAKRPQRVPTLDEIRKILALMPASTQIQQRNRAIIAFAILSGVRDGALTSFRLKHIDLAARSVFQDGRDVKTKGRKTFVSHFFPVGDEPLEIFTIYVAMLRDELGFGPDDPLFPSTQKGHDIDRRFCAIGLTRDHWKSTVPIRSIFREAFEAAGVPYSNPHSYRKTLARLGQRLCRSPEEWKAWSQNLGHESEMTTSWVMVKCRRRGRLR
jgi:integrase/recombinase XerD